VTQVGRTSGATYKTPLDARPVEAGYVFILVHGSQSDSVRNVLAAGRTSLTLDGREIDLTSPRQIDKYDACQVLADSVKPPPRLPRLTEYLRMDLAGERAPEVAPG
jgi:hypothetical protein